MVPFVIPNVGLLPFLGQLMKNKNVDGNKMDLLEILQNLTGIRVKNDINFTKFKTDISKL